MNQEIKTLARKQYLSYFKGWFIVTGIVVAITICLFVAAGISGKRNNTKAPAERVYDFADVLTDSEEKQLASYIAQKEKSGTIDIVIVTLNEPMGISDYEWEYNMMNYADDFYDEKAFGWNKPNGDGICLVDNWYEDENGSQKGSWLSTSGKMEETISWEEEDDVFDAMYAYIDTNPYKAYCAAVDELAYYGKYGYDPQSGLSFYCFALIAPIIVALIYAAVNLTQSQAKDTTVPGTYVENGQMTIRSKSDQFIRKSVSSYRVSSSSGGGGGGGGGHRGGGSGGSHRSSGGHSHGGGGRRR